MQTMLALPFNRSLSQIKQKSPSTIEKASPLSVVTERGGLADTLPQPPTYKRILSDLKNDILLTFHAVPNV